MRYGWRFWFIIAVVIFFAFPNKSYAAFFDVPGVGARSFSTGGAMTALADDPLSAAFYNPAALPDIEGGNFAVGGTVCHFPVHYKSPSGYDEKNNKIAFVPNLSMNSDKFAPFFLGLGLYGTLGIGFDYDKDPGHGIFNSFKSETGNMYLSPVVGYKLNSKISVGVGLDIIYTKLKMGMPIQPTNDFLALDADGFGLGVKVALLYKPCDQLNLGVRWISPAKVDAKGDCEFSGVKDRVTAHFYWPHTLTFGLGWRMKKNFIWLLDLEWIDYSRYSKKSRLSYDNLKFLDGPIMKDLRDARRIHLGCEYLFNESVTLRAGYLFNPWCSPEDQLSPLAPGTNYHSFHLGLGIKSQRFTFDIAFTRAVGDTKRVTQTETGYPGVYKMDCNSLDVALRYHF